MRKTLHILVLSLLSSYSIAQTTAIPDPNFEQALINLGYDTGLPDGTVPTPNIDTIADLNVSYQSISDLTGIQDFSALISLDCDANLLTDLDISQNIGLIGLTCVGNLLTRLDARNGNNVNFVYFSSQLNAGLSCIYVDDRNSLFNFGNWFIDIGTYFANDSLDCQSLVSVGEYSLENMLSIYPNPATNQLTITSIKRINKIEIYNAIGQKVYNETIDNNLFSKVLNIANYTTGVYLVIVKTKDNDTLLKKLIIE